MKVSGKLYPPRSALGEDASLSRESGVLRLETADGSAPEEVTIARLSEPIAGVSLRAELADGRVFVADEVAGMDDLIGGTVPRRGTRIAWFEHMTFAKGLILVGALVVTIIGGRYGLPLVLDGVARAVPESFERRAGAAAFRYYDRLVLRESTLSASRKAEIRRIFDKVISASRLSQAPHIRFRKAPLLGANAFAFPGGPVVITDALIDALETREKISAVLAHEVAHIEARHGLRQVFHTTAVVLAISVMFGDSGTLLEEVSVLAGGIITNGYSRSFEGEADRRGLTMLARMGIPAQALADALRAIDMDCAKDCPSADWLSTHPSTSDRIDAIEHAAGKRGD